MIIHKPVSANVTINSARTSGKPMARGTVYGYTLLDLMKQLGELGYTGGPVAAFKDGSIVGFVSAMSVEDVI